MIAPVGRGQVSLPGTPVPGSPKTSSLQDVYQKVAAREQFLADPAAFDLKRAQHRACGVLSATMLASAGCGVAAHLLLPVDATLGLSAALALGITSIGMAATNEAMDGLLDRSMLVGCGAMSFFAAFIGPAMLRSNVHPLVVGLGLAGGCLAMSWLFSHSMESDHHGLANRLAEAHRVLDKYQAYQQQHEQVLAQMKPADPA